MHGRAFRSSEDGAIVVGAGSRYPQELKGCHGCGLLLHPPGGSKRPLGLSPTLDMMFGIGRGQQFQGNPFC